MSRVPILCRWLLKAIAPIVPGDMRTDWQREWYGELWHWIGTRAAAGDTEAAKVALSHSLGAVKDAIHLRREHQPSRMAFSNILGHPSLPFAVLTLVIVFVAAATGGFERLRRLTGSLPYHNPSQIVVLRQISPLMGARLGLPLVKVENWKEAKSLDSIAAYTGYHAVAEIGDHWREIPAAAVDSEFFRVLGVQAAVGRVFTKADKGACNDCVVVSHEFWRGVLRGDRGAVGRSYSIAGRKLRVIGVLPREFWFFSESPAVWTPIDNGTVVDRTSALVYAVARVHPGVDQAALMADLINLYWKLPPLRHGRSLEIVAIESLTRDPIYAWMPLVMAGLACLFGCLVILVPNRAVRVRACGYFAAKVTLTAALVGIAVVEFFHAGSLRLSGVRGFGSETASLWFLIFGLVMGVVWAWHDQRKRCRTCLRRLSMPVQMGSRGHMLMDRMSTELVCPTGHGVLWAPDDMLESHPTDQWLKLDDSWKDLFAVSDKH